jgi:hypothetical protein
LLHPKNHLPLRRLQTFSDQYIRCLYTRRGHIPRCLFLRLETAYRARPDRALPEPANFHLLCHCPYHLRIDSSRAALRTLMWIWTLSFKISAALKTLCSNFRTRMQMPNLGVPFQRTVPQKSGAEACLQGLRSALLQLIRPRPSKCPLLADTTRYAFHSVFLFPTSQAAVNVSDYILFTVSIGSARSASFSLSMTPGLGYRSYIGIDIYIRAALVISIPGSWASHFCHEGLLES